MDMETPPLKLICQCGQECFGPKPPEGNTVEIRCKNCLEWVRFTNPIPQPADAVLYGVDLWDSGDSSEK